jgi:hypothetical protein
MISTAGREINGFDHFLNAFMSIQFTFGDIGYHGERFSNDFWIDVNEDEKGWKGASPLLVSFLVPTWILLLQQERIMVAIGLHPTKSDMSILAGRGKLIGVFYKTSLNDMENVFVTKDRPNMPGFEIACSHTKLSFTKPVDAEPTRTTMIAVVDHEAETPSLAFTGHIDILADDLKMSLTFGQQVEFKSVSPCSYMLKIGTEKVLILTFPAPVTGPGSKTRVARKSFYVEFVAPAAQCWKSSRKIMYPMSLNSKGQPVLWSMPMVNLGKTPSTPIERRHWIYYMPFLAWSDREAQFGLNLAKTPGPLPMDLRYRFKNTLLMMFKCLTVGHDTPRQDYVIGLKTVDRAGIPSFQLVFFLNTFVLDEPNQSVILDASLLLMTDDIAEKHRSLLNELEKINLPWIDVYDEEMALWKRCLPAFVERCRTWKHLPSCEYLVESKVPRSFGLGQSPLCSCGNGKSKPAIFFPNLAIYKPLQKLLVRVAISPSFPIPVVDDDCTEEAPEGDKCRVCGKRKSKNDDSIFMCGKCGKVQYCSRICQLGDWNDHKRWCKMYRTSEDEKDEKKANGAVKVEQVEDNDKKDNKESTKLTKQENVKSREQNGVDEQNEG